MAADALARFGPAARAWFESSFAAPTPAQRGAWGAIAGGEHTLVLAPTGSGKTLAAFLWAIDRCTREAPPVPLATRVLYVSPLKALAVDVERNLRAPLAGIELEAERLGTEHHEPTVGVRTGDTPGRERQRLARTPPDVLITTPESLYLMCTSRARDALVGVRTVIVDEIHALAGTKRGAHLALTLERLEALIHARDPKARVQRIGLSATQRPLEEIAAYLGGREADGHGALVARPVTVVDAGTRKELDLEVVVPVPDLTRMGEEVDDVASGPAATPPPRRSIWPAVDERLLDLVLDHRSTLIFVNSRRIAERLAARLNDLAAARAATGDPGADAGGRPAPPGDLVRAHHGSLAREQRLAVEDDLKQGRLRGLVATSSLELGIDMGAVDLVVQVESPGSVSAGLQRVGRAGHSVGEVSRGKIFPKHRGDLLEATVVARRMRDAAVESTRYPRNPLDVLAQQIVAACALDEWDVDALFALVRGAANYADLGEDAFRAVLDLLSGLYPSEEFAGLAPLVVWDRTRGRVRGRERAQRVAVTNAGTIPDRGLFGVFLVDGKRVGELDEEMVYESRPGDVFVLGASSWRVEEITHDRVLVTPAPGQPARMPFWHGDRPGRPVELGHAVGESLRELGRADPETARAAAVTEYGLDDWAADNLIGYLGDQMAATGVLPDDRTVVVERFPDEIGDWRVCVHAPYGARVLAPWALAVEERLAARLGAPAQVMWSDDGIVIRLPEAVDAVPVDELIPDPDEVEDLVVSRLPGTSLFASRFRECAARALLLPRRTPGRRRALWQQRQRAADLLEVAARYPAFPIVLETMRECLRDVFDVPALRGILHDIRSRRTRVVNVETQNASPFAQSLLFNWIAAYMYEGDAPLAERRAAALALDRELLRELLGTEELRELLDGEVIAALELELQRLAPASHRARDPDEVHDLLRVLGPLTRADIAARAVTDPDAWITRLRRENRAIAVTVAGRECVAAAEDAARLRDALGCAPPAGLPAAFTAPVPAALDDLLARYAATHAPFTTQEAASAFDLPAHRVQAALAALETEGRVVAGAFRPGGSEPEWCDVGVLRVLRRRTLAALRRDIEPVDPEVFAQFLSEWHGITDPRRGADALADAVAQLQGAPIAASTLERDVLAARVAAYAPALLDELVTSGDLVWCGAGSLAGRDGRVVLAFRTDARLLLPPPDPEPPASPLHDALRARLAAGASFWPDLVAAAGVDVDPPELLDALFDLVWAGEVTNDSLAALRAWRGGRSRASSGARPRPGRVTRLGPPAGSGRWSLVASLRAPEPNATELTHARARQLLERHGVVTREAVRAEGVPGGFAGVYPVLRALEERGQVRRGWFVAGLGAAQFAQAGAVDRLRASRAGDEACLVVLGAADPAQPYGAALPWPEHPGGRPTRGTNAYVVLRAGAPVAHLAGDALLIFPAAAGSDWAEALAGLVSTGRRRDLEIRRIDGLPARGSPHAEALRAAGFRDGYRGLVRR